MPTLPETIIAADDTRIQYSGRVDFTNPAAPVLIYPLSSVKVRFSGTSAKIQLQNKFIDGRQYAGFIIDDDIHGKLRLHPDDAVRTYTLAENLQPGEHEITFFKRMSATGYIVFHGLLLSQGSQLLELPPKPLRRMEAFGDSITSGEVNELVGFEGKPDPPNNRQYDNAWFSYIAMTARNLGAELHNNAQGGLAVLDGTGYFHEPGYLGLESTYNKLSYVPEQGLSPWDFARYTPHVVVVAVGQNDPHPENDIGADPAKKTHWKSRYKEIVQNLRRHYPKALFILTTTLANHSPCWDEAIGEICGELADPAVVHFLYKRNGAATPGHLRIHEHMEMAEELTAFIQSFGEDIWQ